MLLVAQGLSRPDALSDDAFISFRYARHLIEGEGLRFNRDEAPVEGYTNFLWTMLLAGALRVGADPEVAARLLGTGFAIGAQLGSWFLARRLLPASPLAWSLPPLLLAANSFFALEAVQGLETALFACLIVWALAARAPWSGLLFALAALSRPEGLLLALVGGGAALLAGRRPGAGAGLRGLPRAQVVAAILFGAVVLGHLLFRIRYYGDLVPNTFHAKTGGGLPQVWRGLDYLGSGLLRLAPWLALAPLGFLGPDTSPSRRRALAPVALVWLVSAAGIVAVGGDFRPTWRFLVWTVPLLAVLAAAGVVALQRRLPPRAAPGLMAGLTVATLAWTWVGTQPARDFAAQRRSDLIVLREAAAHLDRLVPPGALIATGPSGAIPWYTRRATLDMWGLNDAHIARRIMPDMGLGSPGHEKGDGAYVLGRQPDVILFTAARFSPRPVDPALLTTGWLSVSERELLDQPEFERRYRWRSVRLSTTWFNYFERIPSGPA